jgi:FtsP/CotA-like multicopper oxidase with cupredoxin domain
MPRIHSKTMIGRFLVVAAAGLFSAGATQAATLGLQGPSFNLDAAAGYINQPDGTQVYTWGYGCNGAPSNTFLPAGIGTLPAPALACPGMQIPAPTLVVTEGQTVVVTLTNNLPAAAGNTSMLFPGFQVTAAAAGTQPSTCPSGAVPLVQGVLTMEVTHGCAVTYSFLASSPGTRSYYSGTQGDLQVEMGMYGAIVVLPSAVPANCKASLAAQNVAAQGYWGETNFRLAPAAYDHPKSCYDREYMFQFSEMDLGIHRAAEAQVLASKAACAATTPVGCSLDVPTEPYHPSYFMINGRSMPDDMDPNYAPQYPNQPYNGNPHMHPGEQVLLRVIGQGRWQHPFHEHANHVRILARDGNLLLSQSNPATDLAGLLMFTTTTTPGLAFDGIFYFTGRGLNWDMYGHHSGTDPDTLATLPCTADAYGYNTGFAPTDLNYSGAVTAGISSAANYYEWCADHNKPLEANPYGDVTAGGPMTLPNANIFANGAWYSGSPYFGPDATLRATVPGCATGQTIKTPGASNPTPNCSNLQPSNVQANPANERGYAFMWHSHNEREITTNNVFPGGMFMMMLVDSREFVIDESN